MKNMKKLLAVILAACITATMFAGCGSAGTSTPAESGGAAGTSGQDAPEVEIRFGSNFIGTNAMAEVTQDILLQFEKDYPNVSIVVEGTAGNDHQTKILLDATNNNLPDVFDFWRLDPSFGLDNVAKAGLLADITDWVNTDEAFDGLFDEASWGTATMDGHVYGVPVYGFYIQFLANTEIFEEAGVKIPTTWDELLDACEKLKAAGYIPFGINSKDDSSAIRFYDYIMSQKFSNETVLEMHAGNVPYNTPETVEAVSLIKELLATNMPEDANAIDREAVYAKYVNSERAAMMMDGTWNTTQISDEVASKLQVIQFPLIPGSVYDEPHVQRDLTKLYYISANAWADEVKRPYLQELVRRLTSRDAGKRYLEEAGQAIPMLGVDIDESKVPDLALRAMDVAYSAPGDKWTLCTLDPNKRTRYYALLSEYLGSDMTAQEFVDQMDEIITSG